MAKRLRRASAAAARYPEKASRAGKTAAFASPSARRGIIVETIAWQDVRQKTVARKRQCGGHRTLAGPAAIDQAAADAARRAISRPL